MVGEVWRNVAPKETLVTIEDQGMLPPMAVDRIRRHTTDGTTVLHMHTSKVRAGPDNGDVLRPDLPAEAFKQ
jgi:hypothetical protein